MPRYALKIEYEGSKFSGWQSQKDQLTVQGEIETSLSSFEPSSPRIFGAGRTDSGVHATGQVAHVDLPKLWDPFRLMEAINFNLDCDNIALFGSIISSSIFFFSKKIIILSKKFRATPAQQVSKKLLLRIPRNPAQGISCGAQRYGLAKKSSQKSCATSRATSRATSEQTFFPYNIIIVFGTQAYLEVFCVWALNIVKHAIWKDPAWRHSMLEKCRSRPLPRGPFVACVREMAARRMLARVRLLSASSFSRFHLASCMLCTGSH